MLSFVFCIWGLGAVDQHQPVAFHAVLLEGFECLDTHTPSLSLSLSLSHTHTLSLSLSHTHTLWSVRVRAGLNFTGEARAQD